MSDKESIMLDIAYDEYMAECEEARKQMDLENLENGIYWLQDELADRNVTKWRRERGLRKGDKKAEIKSVKVKKMITRLKTEGLNTSLIQIEIEEAFGIKRSRFYDILKTM